MHWFINVLSWLIFFGIATQSVFAQTQPPDDWLGTLIFIYGSNSSPQTLSTATTYLNPSYFRIDYEWSKAQPDQQVPPTFNKAQDADIDRVISQGAKVYLTFYTGLGWMNDCPGGRGTCGNARSKPPLPQHYDEYAVFLSAFVDHYRGKIAIIGIENEQNSQALFFGGTKEEYIQLLTTAYTAIKTTDSSIIITDGGVVGDVWGACIARSWRDDTFYQTKTDAEILMMMQTFYARAVRNGKIDPIESASDVDALINQVSSECDELVYFLGNWGTIIDRVSFHLYEDYQAIAFIKDWILDFQTRYGYMKPIMTNEIGYWFDPTRYTTLEGKELAVDVFKNLVFLKAHAISPVIWFSSDIRDSDGTLRAVAIIDPQTGQPREAAHSYKLIADTLTRTSTITTKTDGPDVYDYQFFGHPDFTYEFIWQEVITSSLILANPHGNTPVTVTNYKGDILEQQSNSRELNLTVVEPFLITWATTVSGDINLDGAVDFVDFKQLFSQYAENYSAPDLDNNGNINALDSAKLMTLLITGE